MPRWASWRELYPELRFKLDPTPEWTDDQFAELSSLDIVEVADLKGAYHGTTSTTRLTRRCTPASSPRSRARGSRIPT